MAHAAAPGLGLDPDPDTRDRTRPCLGNPYQLARTKLRRRKGGLALYLQTFSSSYCWALIRTLLRDFDPYGIKVI